MINISCATKFHAFYLAEQMEKRKLLNKLITVYHEKRNPLLSKFNSRRDNELIELNHVVTFPLLSLLYRFRNNAYLNNKVFDNFSSRHLRSNNNYLAFIGWSGMSLKSMKQAKKDGKLLILERGSSHIKFQYAILKEEYDRWGLALNWDNRTLEQEQEEYALADYITVPYIYRQ
jgi:hypothetical protein